MRVAESIDLPSGGIGGGRADTPHRARAAIGELTEGGNEMRLEPLGRLSMRYEKSAWVEPFGTAEAAGFGWGEATVSGEVLRGTGRWANYPRRLEDGVWTSNARGVIRTDDGAEILFSLG